MIHRSPCKRSGLTLLELVVVLVILVGLAGIVIPLISNTLSLTRYSTTGANLQGLASVINSYQNKFGGYPDGWDQLTVGTALAAYLPGNTPPAGGAATGTVLQTYLTPVTLTAANVTTLFNGGIANVYPFVATPANPTFYPYGAAESTPGPTPGSTIYLPPTSVPIATGTTLAALTPAGAQLLNLPNTLGPPLSATMPTYIVLGLGSRNTMIPKTILDAPVAFADNAANGPNFQYCRFGVIFQVTDGTALNNPLQAAVMVGVVAFTNEQGISTLGNQIEKYNNALQVGQ